MSDTDTAVRPGNMLLSKNIFNFSLFSFCIWAFLFIKVITVFLHFSKDTKQTSLQSETSLSFLFPQETCFPYFQKPVLASPCCWASQSHARGASKGTGHGGSCLQPESVGAAVLMLSKMPVFGENCLNLTWILLCSCLVLQIFNFFYPVEQ